MQTRKEYVKEVMKELEKMTNTYGYRAIEVAYLIDSLGNGNVDEVTEEQVNQVNNFIDILDDIIDEGVKEEVYNILNNKE